MGFCWLFAADDKKKREEVDIRNGADQMVFQTEKMLKENGDKMPADVKSEAEAKLADLKTAVQSGSIDEIKAKQDELSHVFEKMYQAAAAAQQAAGAQPGPDAGANNQQKPWHSVHSCWRVMVMFLDRKSTRLNSSH